MRVGIVGNGVVGNATGKAFKKRGVDVLYWDLNRDRSPNNLKEVLDTGTVFVCLPTPSRPDGSCDVSHLLAFFTDAQVYASKNLTTFVIRSTAPIGFTRDVHANYHFPSVYHWPEFLTARTAEHDANNPRCLILGKPGGWVFDDQGDTYDPISNLLGMLFGWNFRVMTSCESEAVKLFTNSFFAVKVSVFNELRLLADAKGLDWDKVVGGMLSDCRIHPMHTLVPGPDGERGFGGACLPKDLSSIIRQAETAGIDPFTMLGARATNRRVRGGEV